MMLQAINGNIFMTNDVIYNDDILETSNQEFSI
jgi:hypothetical protein